MTVLASLFFVTSCSDDDEWDAMKWTASTEVTENNSVEVPVEGASYSFVCTNYNKVWLSGINEKGETLDLSSQNGSIQREWGSLECKDNVLTVTFLKNETESNRDIEINVTAGNISDKFNFNQKCSK